MLKLTIKRNPVKFSLLRFRECVQMFFKKMTKANATDPVPIKGIYRVIKTHLQ